MFTVEQFCAMPSAPSALSPPETVRKSAFYLESQGQPLFAWLHQRATSALSHGVVLCPPVGYEQVHAHRSWRLLADAFAAAGFAALRLDYHGTGDSAGTDEDPNRLAVWTGNVRDALLWMKEQLGCDKVSLAGLRLGASLAVQVAQTEEVENLLLWAPVVSGRHYVREMKALSLTATTKAPKLPEGPDDIEAAGFVVTRQTADDLSKLDLLKLRPRCERALILSRDDLPEDRRLLDHLTVQGVRAEQAAHPGYAGMMREPHYTEVPRQAIAYAASWLLSCEKAWEDETLQPAARLAPAGPVQGQDPRALNGFRMVSPGVRERTLLFREGLFGVLSEPAKTDEKLPVIVMLNAGAAYRIGASRLYVLLARKLAAEGFRCLRLDLGGLGDSLPAGCEGDNDTYAATAFRDVEVTLQHVKAELGGQRVALLGLCSGAYFAFQSAVQIPNPLLVESVLINPLTYYWKEGMSLEAAPAKEHAAFQYLWRTALEPANWMRYFRGRTRVGIGAALTMLFQRLRLRRPRGTGTVTANESIGHPARQDLAADLDLAVRRGRHLTCFFSRADPGYGLLTFYAKRKVRELTRAKKLDVFFCEDANHTFSYRVPRRAVVQAISEHLCRRYRKP